jgi:ribosomal-protein-alanine N-acetyltransferase
MRLQIASRRVAGCLTAYVRFCRDEVTGLLRSSGLRLDDVMTSASTQDGARQVILQTARTVLTTWLDGDAEDLANLHSDAETMRFVRNGRPESRSEVEDLVRLYVSQQGDRRWAKWRLADLDGRLIGRAGFGGTDELRGISYLIARPLWGKGLATEISRALVAWHLSNAPHARLRALVVQGNDASIRVLEKVGFQEAGVEEYEGAVCWKYVYPTVLAMPG